MASSPNPQPNGPPSPVIPILTSILPPIESPPDASSFVPPPSNDSPPRPEQIPPPPPSPPLSPHGPHSSPPPSHPGASPPPASPPPLEASMITKSPPVAFQSPPSPSLPSPPDPLGSIPVSPPPTTFASPPPVDPLSPPTPPTSFPSPPIPPSSSPSPPSPPSDSTPTGSAPRPPSKSGSSGSRVRVNPVAHSSKDSKTGIAIGVVVGVFIIAFLALICLQRRRKRHTRYNSMYMMPSPYTFSPTSGTSFINQKGDGGEFLNLSSDNPGIGNSKTWFSYEELSAASDGFAAEKVLGAGGFGCVYKGCLQDGREVAIKKLKDNSGQGDREFKAEVEIISRVHHRYLVSLVGHCITDSQRLLVYEFVPNGTLHDHLHNTKKAPMQWNFRVKVACGSARGITYLHEDCHPRIIHRDIKSANILIDNNFEAKVADFGLAKIAQELESNTHVSTRVMGTFGYMAPEYASSGKLTEKSDVFSFGVVLLEIITGRKPVDETRPLGDESLVEWARPLMTEALENQNFDELADPKLQGNYDRGEMFRMVEAAATCVRHSAIKRPRMSQVVRALNSMNELSDISNGMKPGQSGIYDSGEQSAQIKMFRRMAFGSQEFSSEYQNSPQCSWSIGGRSGLAGDRSEQV
ncbi:proline-rich receptor-like protein kinase PERK8 [Amaranthus tricolor]|uniref:proline-rich receptor-like protein kinase PERK8 n=1 Tax=Amaranthus tricolor TaxID=29722 RepID=UPI00258B32BE|nr:proline-rich receptor-like protein kinase PERK8 [Amaranthus tricolor]